MALSGLGGAGLAVAIVFGAAGLGYFPAPNDRQFRDYLMGHPSLVFAMAEKAQRDEAEDSTRKLQSGVDKVGLARFFDPRVAYVTGPKNAKRSLVEFFDYNCAHCRNTYPVIQKFYNAHKNDTRFAFVEFPIFGEESDKAARSALAARLQPDKYVAYHFALMGEDGAIGAAQMIDAAQKVGLDVNKLTKDLSDPAINREMAAAHALSARIGNSGTPLFIINGQVHSGEIDEASLKAMSMSLPAPSDQAGKRT